MSYKVSFTIICSIGGYSIIVSGSGFTANLGSDSLGKSNDLGVFNVSRIHFGFRFVVNPDPNPIIEYALSINLPEAVTLGGTYDVGRASPAGLEGHVICCSGRSACSTAAAHGRFSRIRQVAPMRPHVTHASFGPPEYTTQTASRSV